MSYKLLFHAQLLLCITALFTAQILTRRTANFIISNVCLYRRQMLVCMIIEETKEQERNQHHAFEEETSDWYERHPACRDADQRLRDRSNQRDI